MKPLCLLPLLLLAGPDDKLDEGLAEATGHQPIFVRMSDQLFRKGGDYEAFCRENQAKPRTKLRADVMATLHAKSEAAWAAIAPVVSALEESGALRGTARTWIVNGFFGEATAEACKELASQESVAFVYRQRVVMQHAAPRRGRRADPEQEARVLAKVLEGWHDDSAEPFDPEGLAIPWNLERIRAPQAWKESTGKGVVVALLDTGLTVTPALTRALWRNPKEELNGKDDDGNGYADDLFGWDFVADNRLPLGDAQGHGSMCGGIVGGRPGGEKRTSTGIAPRARLMILRGMGFLRAYEYAAANGADVMSMSYMWVNQPLGHFRGVYRLAHEHLAAIGVVAVGGAGNFARLPRGRQIALPKDIPCVVAAAGILKDGSKAPASSEGPCYWNGVKFYDDYPPEEPLQKPDVTGCFGGYPVWAPSRMRRPAWRVVEDLNDGAALIVGPQGNSFAGPHAAGVAALMLSKNPDLPAWRVKELMEATCKDIGEKGRDPVFGAGLLQADAAVAAAGKAK